ncbi:hypothetical protein Aperf_G00000075171 [Anoplocephala perfoliata]
MSGSTPLYQFKHPFHLSQDRETRLRADDEPTSDLFSCVGGGDGGGGDGGGGVPCVCVCRQQRRRHTSKPDSQWTEETSASFSFSLSRTRSLVRSSNTSSNISDNAGRSGLFISDYIVLFPHTTFTRTSSCPHARTYGHSLALSASYPITDGSSISLFSRSLCPSRSPITLYASVPVRDFKRAAVSADTRPHAMSKHAQLKCCPSYANPHLSPILLPLPLSHFCAHLCAFFYFQSF